MPLYPHLALTENVGEMRVTWKTNEAFSSLLASSSSVATAGINEKEQSRRRKMAVAASAQEVQYARADKGVGERDRVSWTSTPATISSFTKQDLCGAPATSIGYMDVSENCRVFVNTYGVR